MAAGRCGAPRGPAAVARAAVAACLLLAARGFPVRAAGVRSADPYWFRDGYTTLDAVDVAASSAQVDTAGTGTVELGYAPAQAAFDPAGTYALVATEGGAPGFVFDGAAVAPLPGWALAGVGATGAAWVAGGGAFVLTTAQAVALYGLVGRGRGYRAVRLASAAFPGALGAAPGPAGLPLAALVATPQGAVLLAVRGASLVPLPGGPAGLRGNRGVAATADGAVAATWQATAVQLWVWNGRRYTEARPWEPPPPPAAAGPVVGVAFFPSGAGYWLLTAEGYLLGYAYGPSGVAAVPAASARLPPLPLGVASGWGGAAAAVLYPDGWLYEDPRGGALAPDALRSLGGQRWAVYQPESVLQSVPLPVGHPVREVEVEDADCPADLRPSACSAAPALPPGTSVAYAVSTDGCRSWAPVPAFTPTAVAPGEELCYRLLLRTSDPAVTPVVDVTDLYEVARRFAALAVPAYLCLGTGCR